MEVAVAAALEAAHQVEASTGVHLPAEASTEAAHEEVTVTEVVSEAVVQQAQWLLEIVEFSGALHLLTSVFRPRTN